MKRERWEAVARRVEARGPWGDSVMAFDADGTLWTGDVGEALLEACLQRRVLGSQVHAALKSCALQYLGSERVGQAEPEDLLRAMVRGYEDAVFPEQVLYEVTAWLLSGATRTQVHAFANQVLDAMDITSLFQDEAIEALRWAQVRGIAVYVVSASPEFMVTEAVARLGAGPLSVVAIAPVYVEGRMVPEVERPVPYAAGKVEALRRRIGERRILSAFGDNAFDESLLAASEVPVAVRPKERLRRRAHAIAGLVELERPSSE